MIRLRNIHRDNGKIICDAFVEDSNEVIKLAFDESTEKLQQYSLPAGYEWCDSHIAYAVRFFRSIIGKPIESDERNIMWY